MLEKLQEDLQVGNIAEVAIQVKMRICPVALLSWSCSVLSFTEYRHRDTGKPPKITFGVDNRESEPFDGNTLLFWSIVSGDMELLKFVLDLKADWAARMAKENIPVTRHLYLEADLMMAIKMGRLGMAAELIRRCGAGINLEELVKESGVKFVEKPKYYQGLSVRFSYPLATVV